MFKINNDLENIKLNFHNLTHVIFSFILSILISPFWAYLIGLLWEIGDGFKPYYYKYSPISNSKIIEFLRKELLFSDKFSLQDILVWNVLGCALGMLVKLGGLL